jgi:heavy metal sensor kinase
MTMQLKSVRFRLTLWYAVVMATVVVISASGVYLFLQTSLLRQIDNHLDRDLTTVIRVISQGPQQLDVLAHHGNVSLFRVEIDSILIAETDGWLRTGLNEERIEGHKGPVWIEGGADGHRFRIKNTSVEIAGKVFRVIVAHDAKIYSQSLSSLTMVLLPAIPVVLLLAVAGGYFMAGRALAPLAALVVKARGITAARLSERLPVENPDDEFGQLAQVFNDTFQRLEDSFERLQRFTADASHELRTPLTAIRSVGEVGMQEATDAAACREVIGSMLEETDRLTKLVDSLLVLSRADSCSIPVMLERTDLSLLAAEVTECLLVLAEEKQQAMSVVAPIPVYANVDQSLLRQALINLLDNAIKYTPVKGFIQVVVESSDNSEAVISVCDNGSGISAEHRQRIFERFYRIDRGRSREIGGAGLGLSIASWAVVANNGRIELESTVGGGSTFRILIPLQ